MSEIIHTLIMVSCIAGIFLIAFVAYACCCVAGRDDERRGLK